MFIQIIAICIIAVVSYVSSVFLVPEVMDIYGSKSLNDDIRQFKAKLDTDTANFGSGKSLIEKVSDIAKPYIDETRETTERVKQTIDTKTEQVKKAAESVEKALDAVDSAKSDIQKLKTFGSGSMSQ